MPFEISSEADLSEVEARAKTSPNPDDQLQIANGIESGPEVISWPDRLRAEAFHGVAGEFVRLIEPHSEGDPAAILIQTLVAFANVIGRSAYFRAEADRHYTSLYLVIVGATSKGRKGTSWGQVRRVFEGVDAEWAKAQIMGGLASGEGLIHVVSDDGGRSDKRLLVMEPEFARVLQVSEREGNTLSAIIRQAWDTGMLSMLTRKNPLHASDAHICIIGHITRDEVRRLLTDTAAVNGFANRFLWCCARRSKMLPDGGALDTEDFEPIVQRIRLAVDFALQLGELRRDDSARILWHEFYPSLSEGHPGLLGAVTSRAEAQTMRLACVYAVLDRSPVIRREHLLAGLAVWQYCEASARWLFGATLGDATADEILRILRERPEGLTRTEISAHFRRHKPAAEIGRALSLLSELGRARMDRQPEGEGRRTERWSAT
ncbi:MAG: DUF3987 domain-containing protein [Acidobacteriia bacterium]|nr:DUF3987 domain-containing protein [Terriglobia bacterium]